MSREHLKIEYNEKYNFNKVTCTEGHFITNWDGVDYREYTASTIMYAPVSVNLDEFYCVTEEQHKENLVKHLEAVEAEMAKVENEINGPSMSGDTTTISGTTI